MPNKFMEDAKISLTMFLSSWYMLIVKWQEHILLSVLCKISISKIIREFFKKDVPCTQLAELKKDKVKITKRIKVVLAMCLWVTWSSPKLNCIWSKISPQYYSIILVVFYHPSDIVPVPATTFSWEKEEFIWHLVSHWSVSLKR